MTIHLCATCALAVWKRREGGNLHPNGEGYCDWKPPYIPTPAKWYWDNGQKYGKALPRLLGRGAIVRKLGLYDKAVTECETYVRKV